MPTAAAAAKSLQSCPTLCDPIDGSPPGSPVPEIFQARTLEWVAISFSNAWKWKVKVKSLSRVWLLATPWTAAYQAPPSMGFSRQEYWSGVPLPSLMPTAVSHIAPPWALPRGSTPLTMLSRVWGLFPSSPLRRFTLCSLFSSWLPVGCSWPQPHLLLQRDEVFRKHCLQSEPLSWKLKAGQSAYAVAHPGSFQKHGSSSPVIPVHLDLGYTHACACTRVHTHTRTLAHSKRERNKNFLPPLLIKQFHLNWPSSLRDLQDGSESDGGRIRQIRKQMGRLGGELQGLLSLAPLNIFPLLWSNVCII